MTQNERISIMRIVSDLIKADAIIDAREIEWLTELREKYNIKRDDEIIASRLTLAQAIETLKEMDPSVLKDTLGDFIGTAMSDAYCAREEALLILALQRTLGDNRQTDAQVYSIEVKDGIDMEDAQVLYVESNFDDVANKDIQQLYRELSTEFKLAGFDFVYLPQMSTHYREVTSEDLNSIIAFLFPAASEASITRAIERIYNLSTSNFCKDYLVSKMELQHLEDTNASLLIKIGNDRVNGCKYANFLHIELEDDILQCVRDLVDDFSRLYKTRVLNYLEETEGRFVYTGFYRRVIDLLMLRRGIRSRVVADAVKCEIRLPDADTCLMGLHRREKALYTLFLMESASGGINFTPPPEGHTRLQERFDKRMDAVQRKYELIYHAFGGDAKSAPNLRESRTRLPMLALIKRRIREIEGLLHNPDDYLVQRNMYGNYCVKIGADLCLCYDVKTNDFCEFKNSETWSRIQAL